MHHIFDFMLITRNLARMLVSYPIKNESDWDCIPVEIFKKPRSQVQFHKICREKRTLPRALEEEAHHKDLQSSHGHHHQALNHTEVENPALGAADSTEVAVLASTEVLLVAGDGR